MKTADHRERQSELDAGGNKDSIRQVSTRRAKPWRLPSRPAVHNEARPLSFPETAGVPRVVRRSSGLLHICYDPIRRPGGDVKRFRPALHQGERKERQRGSRQKGKLEAGVEQFFGRKADRQITLPLRH